MTGIEQTKKVAVWLQNDGAVVRNLHPKKITLSAGAKRLPTCELELAGSRDIANDSVFPIQAEPQAFTPGTTLTSKYQDEFCYVAKDVAAGARTEIYHFGVISSWKAGSSPDSLTLVSTVPQEVFARPIIEGRYFTGTASRWTDLDLVFNPVVDSIVRENRYTQAGFSPIYTLLHPQDNTITDVAARGYWTHESIISYLLEWHLQPTAPLDQARSLANFNSAVSLKTLPRPQNISIEKGTKFLDAIERVLRPIGMDFAIVPYLPNPFSAKSARYELVFWFRETGLSAATSTKFNLGAWNLVTSDDATITDADVDVRLFDKNATSIYLLGAPRKYEVTVELLRGWDPAVEEQIKADPSLTNKGSSKWDANPGLASAYRDWVLNEDGAYTGLAVADLEAITGTSLAASSIPYPRKFLPCLTLADDGTPIGKFRGIDIEWWDGTEWKGFEEGVEIMQNRCGIRITQSKLNPRILRPDAKVRVTACIEIDSRLSTLVNRRTNMPGRTNVESMAVIETKDKFVVQQVSVNSKYYLNGQPTLERDDSTLLDEYAERVADGWCRLNLQGKLTVEDVDLTANSEIGKYIRTIAGRTVSLNTTNTGATYPVITGFTIDFDSELTTYFTESETGGIDA